jgi:hypothetical protein
MAWAKHAAGCGLTLEQIKDDLLSGGDLSKKGNRNRVPISFMHMLDKAHQRCSATDGLFRGVG